MQGAEKQKKKGDKYVYSTSKVNATPKQQLPLKLKNKQYREICAQLFYHPSL